MANFREPGGTSRAPGITGDRKTRLEGRGEESWKVNFLRRRKVGEIGRSIMDEQYCLLFFFSIAKTQRDGRGRRRKSNQESRVRGCGKLGSPPLPSTGSPSVTGPSHLSRD